MDRINRFFTELRRCEDTNPYYIKGAEWGYNGVAQRCWIDGYHNYVRNLYNDALDELPMLSEEVKGIYTTRLKEIEELQNCFDAPSQDILDAMERDYISNKNECLKEEMEHVRFVLACISLQKFYRIEFGKYLYVNNKKDIQQIVENRTTHQRDNLELNSTDKHEALGESASKNKSHIIGDVVRGRKGVVELTGLKLSSVQKLLNQGIIVPSPRIRGVLDRTLIFSKKELEEQLFGNPIYEQMKSLSRKRRK